MTSATALAEYALLLLALLALVPVLVIFVQVALACLPGRSPACGAGRRPSVAVLMPAHNEERVIAETLAGIVPQLESRDRLLVVADNCDDDTAEIARGHGAEVIERTDLERRGKGYALDFGVRHLEASPVPPEVVIVIDADCQVGPGSIDRLSRCCLETGQPVQALYLMKTGRPGSLKQSIAEFAWRLKNQVRPLGYHRLGFPCQLMGTGMAFAWPVIRGADLANGHIVEDMKLGVDLAISGHGARFCPDARLTSRFPEDGGEAHKQRTRWEHGHLGVILKMAPALFRAAIRKRSPALFALALDLFVPPVALLAILVAFVFVLSVVVFLVAGVSGPLEISVLTVGSFAVAILAAWWGWGRDILSTRAILLIPLYIVGKVPIYVAYVFRRQKKWVKTGRD